MKRAGRGAWSLLWVLALLGGCATVPPQDGAPSPVVRGMLVIGGVPIRAEWTVPAGKAGAFVSLQHGYAQHCAGMARTAQRIAAAGSLVLCLEASMAQGNPALARGLAALLVAGAGAPAGMATPARIIVAGHSAGASFAASLGARLDELAPDRLAGALLFDPVATDNLEADLRRVASAGLRPVLAITAPAGACNANHNAYAALRAVRREAQAASRGGLVGIEFTQGSTHTDVLGEDADWLAVAVCGRSLPSNTEQIRAIAAAWVRDVINGTLPAPTIPPVARWIE
jgi:pimeloyl-ACP methyl ester carboxylesterase